LCWLCKMPLALSAWGVCSVCTRSLERRITTCPQCGLPPNRYLPCGRCLKKPPPWSALVAVDDYVPPLSRLIHALKFSGQSSLAHPLPACYCWRFYRRGEPRPAENRYGGQCPSPSPLAAWLQPERPALPPLARWLGCRYTASALTRVHATAVQHQLNARLRKRNLKNAFRLELRLTASISRLWMMSSPQAVPLLNFPDCFCKAAPRRFRYGVCAVPCSPSSMGV
jgi:predicted amidophosphoribosyltransferase